MKFTLLNGKIQNINLSQYIISPNDKKHRSQLCQKALFLVKEIYPSDIICGEVGIKNGSSIIYIDILVYSRRLALEVNGRQHEEFVPHFHKNKLEFCRAQRRDREKQEVLELNNIILVELNYNEDIITWKNKLLNRFEAQL